MSSLFAIMTEATCGEACWSAKEEVCRCSCGGKNHGIYKTDDLQRALHNAIKTANDATRRAKDARKEAQYLSLLIKAARFKKEIGESMTPILDGIALFYRTGRRTPKDAKMFERVIREELLHAFHRHAEGLTDEEFEAENSRY
jgi:hypothetical protein